MFRDERFDRGRLQFVVFLFGVWQFREPFPPIHPGNRWAVQRQVERDIDATLLDFLGMVAAHLESPGLSRGPRAHIVADLDKEKFLVAMRLRVGP